MWFFDVLQQVQFPKNAHGKSIVKPKMVIKCTIYVLYRIKQVPQGTYTLCRCARLYS